MEAGVAEPPALYERFTVTYPSGTVIQSFYSGGATLREVQMSHPMATRLIGHPGLRRRQAAPGTWVGHDGEVKAQLTSRLGRCSPWDRSGGGSPRSDHTMNGKRCRSMMRSSSECRG
jgi:hypothetical protein